MACEPAPVVVAEQTEAQTAAARFLDRADASRCRHVNLSKDMVRFLSWP